MEPTIALPTVDEPGLTGEQVAQRVARGEINAVRVATSRSFGQILRANVFTLFNGIIITAMLVTLVAGSWKDAVFGLVIVVNTGIGVATELRAKRTLDKLSILVASNAMVRRDGRDVEIPHEGIVLGDLLWIRSGDQVPADGRVVRDWGIELDESMLTGESRTVGKRLDEQVYSGSTAVSGMALIRVDAVGEHGYAAKLTAKAKVYTKTVSDLNRGINTILKFMTLLVVPLCVLLVWSQLNTVGGWDVAVANGAWRGAIVSAVAGVVGMIPEGLVLLTSLNFAIAAIRLARANTLVQELESVETLARVDNLNLDKTGTITDGGIVFERIVPLDGNADPRWVTQALFDLSNEESPNATSQAVLAALQAQGFAAGEVESRVPFSSARKWSSITRPAAESDQTGDAEIPLRGEGSPSASQSMRGGDIWYLGAPEILLDALEVVPETLKSTVDRYAREGSRVLLIARAQGDGVASSASSSSTASIRSDAVAFALAVCAERVRDDAESTLAWFREQGVRCRIISGDNPLTVGAIAATVRLTGASKPETMDARDLPDDIDELAQVMEHVDVLGRVLPDQKKAIVQALHRNGHVVAMTGDGVNDALAIKEADLGIAMGNAAPATKAVAQVVLVDSQFSHLPEVVARGRQVMANMERVAGLFLVKTVYSALIALGVVLTAIPFPYLPRHITYIGSLTIGIPAFVLALAPNTRRYLPGFLRRVVEFALPGGVAIAVSVLLSAWMLPGVMGWNVADADDLAALRATCAIVVFVLGILVMATVARPLRSWRGWLVVLFAVVGVTGLFVPVVRNFFALIVPSGPTLAATLLALGIASVIFALCQLLMSVVKRLVSHTEPSSLG